MTKAKVSAVKIDKDIPLPDRCILASKYPLNEMKVGDSMYVDKRNAGQGGWLQYYSLKSGYRFATRREGNGTRIWRIK
jgi:hypothetical protein